MQSKNKNNGFKAEVKFTKLKMKENKAQTRLIESVRARAAFLSEHQTAEPL